MRQSLPVPGLGWQEMPAGVETSRGRNAPVRLLDFEP